MKCLLMFLQCLVMRINVFFLVSLCMFVCVSWWFCGERQIIFVFLFLVVCLVFVSVFFRGLIFIIMLGLLLKGWLFIVWWWFLVQFCGFQQVSVSNFCFIVWLVMLQLLIVWNIFGKMLMMFIYKCLFMDDQKFVFQFICILLVVRLIDSMYCLVQGNRCLWLFRLFVQGLIIMILLVLVFSRWLIMLSNCLFWLIIFRFFSWCQQYLFFLREGNLLCGMQIL